MAASGTTAPHDPPPVGEAGEVGEVGEGLARRRGLALAAPVFGLLIVGLDATILTVALPTLATQLEATTTELQWFTDGYTLPFAGLLLLFGVLGDRIGRRLVLVGGLLLFGIGSAMVMGVDSPEGLILARVVMGAGAAAITPLALSIVPLMFPPEERSRAMAVATAGFALGLPLGPLAGGWLLSNFWWGSIFLINIPVVVVAVAGILLFVPETRDPNAERLDLIGAALSLAGVSAFVYGVIEVPNAGWSDPVVPVTVLGGLALLVALLFRLRRAAHPLFDLGLFRNARFTWSSVAISAVMFILFGVLFVVPQFLQQVQGMDAMATGLHLLPMIGTLIVAAAMGGRLVCRIGTKGIVAAGMVLWAAGLALLATVDADTDFVVTGTALAVMGAALGFTMPTALEAILGSLPAHQVGAGSALANSMRQIGASVGVAVLGSALNSTYRDEMADQLPAALPEQARTVAEDHVAGALQVAERLPVEQGAVLADAARNAFVAGMSAVALICAGLAAVTAVLVVALLPGRAAGTRQEPPSGPVTVRAPARSRTPVHGRFPGSARPRRSPDPSRSECP
ncbi:DHA2 family efflux MFS transporter permease subunit [Streptomyces qinzhouensis]|uniref:DHA2 family efflux MFS transporter permease subunit n=1 Tax=Streptomyces qinzhouensis TaxID=2599401 RepID=A0A5B8IFA3_9ACTN|nr:DHA2 family efflux MFS transporter permease subunit [Streptomyces qinzhouensis]QDY76802.1 DHA2 family efflux MFS transporter permease subunit [Streptomyces qinzhouensis]